MRKGNEWKIIMFMQWLLKYAIDLYITKYSDFISDLSGIYTYIPQIIVFCCYAMLKVKMNIRLGISLSLVICIFI